MKRRKARIVPRILFATTVTSVLPTVACGGDTTTQGTGGAAVAPADSRSPAAGSGAGALPAGPAGSPSSRQASAEAAAVSGSPRTASVVAERLTDAPVATPTSGSDAGIGLRGALSATPLA